MTSAIDHKRCGLLRLGLSGWASAVALATALIASPVAGGDSRIDAARHAAMTALAKRDPITAEVTLRRAVASGVPIDAVRALLGEALYRQGDPRDAEKLLGEGHFSPDSAGRGLRMRALIAMGRGDFANASAELDEAVRRAGDDADVWTTLASLRFTLGNERGAIEAAAQAVRLDPANPSALAVRGMLVREQIGLAAALPWFESAIKDHPDEPALLVQYAETLGDMGQYGPMLAVCRKLNALDPHNPLPLFMEAVIAGRAGRTQLARAILQRTGQTLRDMPAAILLSGVLDYRAGNVDLAIAAFDRLARLQRDNSEARLLLARALARKGLWRQVTQRFDADAARPDAAPYLLALVGEGWIRLGERAKGLGYRERARHPQPRIAPSLLPNREGAGSPEGVPPLAVLAQRHADAPQDAASGVPYVRALLASGDKDRAQAVADGLRDANPGASDAFLLAGDVRMARGDVPGALADYGRGGAIRFNRSSLVRTDAALRMLGRWREADSMTSRALAQNPESLAAMRILALSWADPARHRANQRIALVRALAARGQAAPR